MKKQLVLKPQDLLVALKLAISRPEWSQLDLAMSLGISPAEIFNSLNRLVKTGLLTHEKKEIKKLPLENLIIYGVPIIYPPEIGPMCIGMPVAHAGPILKDHFKPKEPDIFVWPHTEGSHRGQGLFPFYKSAPLAAKNDQHLYEVLSLIEALRVGKAREKELAKKKIHEILS